MKNIILLIILCLPIVTFAQDTKKISGQVLEAATGQPLPGATVFIDPDSPESKDYSPAGTVTDINGYFELVLPAAVKYVVVSFVGYEALKADISKGKEFTFRLKTDNKQLDEVVVTGYQQIDKRKVTSAITTVKADDIKAVGIASVDQMLEGQVAGMMVTPTNGAPGAPAKMRIRSTVSLSGSTDPLWVLDGMILEGNDIPSDFGDKDNIDNLYNTSIAGVNPADIENITILKDAAATAIYGARAANGVIVITTKKGRSGKMRVNASASAFVTTRPKLSKLNLMNSSEKVDWELGIAARPELDKMENGTEGGVRRILAKYDQLNAYREGGFAAISADAQNEINNLRNINTDWGKEIYQAAVNQQYNLSLSGGSDFARYYASAGYYKESGTTIGTGFERFNMTLKTDFNLHEKVNMGISLFMNHNKQTSYLTDADAFINSSRYTRTVNPYLEIWDKEGNYVYDPDIQGKDSQLLDFNYIEERENTDYYLKTLSLKPMVTLDYRLIDGLRFSTQLGVLFDRSSMEKLAEEESYYVRKYRYGIVYNGDYFLPEGAIIQNQNTDMSQYHWKLQGEFNKTLGGMHTVDVMTGMEMRGDKTTRISTKGFGYDPKALTTQPVIIPEGYSSANSSSLQQYKKELYNNRNLSYFMTASYTYAERYTFFGSLRYDGSNLFGVAKKYKYLPLWSVSGAWNVSQEAFLEDADWLSNLKLRASYGIQGNVDKNTSPYIVGSWGTTSILPDNNEQTITVTSPPNQNLRWEKTSNWNVGVDMGVFQNRITFSVDAYHRVSDDLIGIRAIAGENGFDNTTMNWAKLTNKGFEFALSTVNIRTHDFRWKMDFNIAHNKSKVNRVLVRDEDRLPSIEGYSVGAKFSIKTAGVDAKTGMPLYMKDGQAVSMVDYFKITPLDPYIPIATTSLSNEEFRDLFTYEGTTEPKFTGGFINRFYYKNFDLTISTSFILKQTVQEQPFYSPTDWYAGQNYSNRMLDVWSPENPNGKYQGLLGTDMMNSDMYLAYTWFDTDFGRTAFQNYDIWYKEMSYLRVNSIRLGYNLGERALKKLHVSAARISFEARNPFVFGSSYKGYFDPETYGNIYAQPLPKTFSCGLELTF